MRKARHTKRGSARHRRKTRRIRGGEGGPDMHPSVRNLKAAGVVSSSPFRKAKFKIPDEGKPIELLAKIKRDTESLDKKSIVPDDIETVNSIITESNTLDDYLTRMAPIYRTYDIPANNSLSRNARSAALVLAAPVFVNIPSVPYINPNSARAAQIVEDNKGIVAALDVLQTRTHTPNNIKQQKELAKEYKMLYEKLKLLDHCKKQTDRSHSLELYKACMNVSVKNWEL